MENNKIFKKQALLIIIAILFFGIVLIGFSYAYFVQSDAVAKKEIVTIEDLSLTFDQSSTMTPNLKPLNDEAALKEDNNLFTFTVRNLGDAEPKYYLTLQNDLSIVKDPNNMLDHQYFRISVDGGTPFPLTAADKSATTDFTKQNGAIYLISNFYQIKPKQINKHTIRIWLDENAPTKIIGQAISLKISLTK